MVSDSFCRSVEQVQLEGLFTRKSGAGERG